jgi:hypothetical protein
MGGLIKYSTTTPVQARSADELAALYGVKNKESDYAASLGAATEAKFGMWDTQMKGIRDQQLTDYSAQFSQYQNYQRQNRQNALRSGLSRGSAIAQEVMSQVQNQAYGAQNQTGYQQQLGDIAAQKGAQLGADKYNAFDMANQTNLALGGLSTTQHQSDSAAQTGYQQYLAGLAQARASQSNADATTYAADQGNLMYKETLKVLGAGNEALAIEVASGKMDIRDAINLVQQVKNNLPNLALPTQGVPATASEVKLFNNLGALPKNPVNGTVASVLGQKVLYKDGQWFKQDTSIKGPTIKDDGVDTVTGSQPVTFNKQKVYGGLSGKLGE